MENGILKTSNPFYNPNINSKYFQHFFLWRRRSAEDKPRFLLHLYLSFLEYNNFLITRNKVDILF